MKPALRLSEKLEIRLSWPAKALWSNSRVHWAVKAKAAKNARWWAFIGVREIWRGYPGPEVKVQVSVKAYKHGRGALPDRDNLISACKAYFDGLVDAGICPSDRPEHFELGTITIERGDVSEVVLIVEPLELVLRPKEER